MKSIKKENRPKKICVTCNRPFTWRKKWAKVWESVKYCSDTCRGKKITADNVISMPWFQGEQVYMFAGISLPAKVLNKLLQLINA